MYEQDFTFALDTIAPGITAEIGANQSQGETWMDSLARLLPILATTYQQKQLLEVQMQRARQGQPPLDVSMYAPSVRVGLSEDTKNMLLIGGAVVAAIVVAMMLNKRK